MSQVRIGRRDRQVQITLTTATASALTIRTDDMAGGVISLGTMSTNSVSLQIWGAHSEDGPFRRLYGSDGAAADITLAPSTAEGRIYSLPDAVYAMPCIKIVSGSTNSTGTVGVVSLKS